MKIKRTFISGTAGKVEAEFELPESYLDHLMRGLDWTSLHWSKYTFDALNANPDDPTDMRNFCKFSIGGKDLVEKAREELASLRRKAA